MAREKKKIPLRATTLEMWGSNYGVRVYRDIKPNNQLIHRRFRKLLDTVE